MQTGKPLCSFQSRALEKFDDVALADTPVPSANPVCGGNRDGSSLPGLWLFTTNCVEFEHSVLRGLGQQRHGELERGKQTLR